MSVIAKAPKFWDHCGHPLGLVLAPAGLAYGLAVRARFAFATPVRSKLPVICIGNFTVGGGGKTPLAIEVATLLREQGHKPFFLTRGYGGNTKGPHLVDLARDSAVDVGDEPLILAQTSHVVVSADRVAGARFIEQMDADVIIMDDGFQNPSLHKDFSLIVVDEISGTGNGRVFPAGPLRASMAFQMPKADALVLTGPGPAKDAQTTRDLRELFDMRFFCAELRATGEIGWLKGTRILAMTGIARPEKFHASLEELGAIIVQKHDFPDHHMFTEKDAEGVLSAAKRDEIPVVMTHKDMVRLPDSGARARLRKEARVLHVSLAIREEQRLLETLQKAISFASRYSD